MMLLILVLVVVWIFYYKSIEPFALIPVPNDSKEEGEEENVAKHFFNAINNNINPSEFLPIFADDIAAATQGVQTENQTFIADAYDNNAEPGTAVQTGVYYEPSADLITAQTVCETTKTANCDAFDKDDFNANCGINLDLKGYDSQGKISVGGLFIKPAEKANVPANGIYNPTYGRSSKFAVNKATCEFMKNDIACKNKQHPIGHKNCSYCFSDGSYHAVEPTTTKLRVDFILFTNATGLNMWIGQTSYTLIPFGQEKASSNVIQGASVSVNGVQYKQVTLSQVLVKEGDVIYLSSWSTTPPFGVAGYFQAVTQTEVFSKDLNAIMDGQLNPFSRPKYFLTPNIGGQVQDKYMLFTPFDEWPSVIFLKGIMPFTFMNPTSQDAYNCQNGPFITTKNSMSYMTTNAPCYDPATGDGTYKLACLQQLFLASGGTRAGKGYPVDEKTSRVLLFADDGKARTLNGIGQYLYQKSTLAATGLQEGQSVSLATWNEASIFMTNRSITNPCEVQKRGQPISKECLSYLYSQSGCGSKGTYNPDKNHPVPPAIAAAKASGDIQAARNFYRKALNTVNTSSLSREQRAPAFRGCFGIELLKAS